MQQLVNRTMPGHAGLSIHQPKHHLLTGQAKKPWQKSRTGRSWLHNISLAHTLCSNVATASAAAVDIAVIGAGPCGLALALGLLKAAPQYSVRVFEKVSKWEPKGAGLTLNFTGLKALRVLSPEVHRAVKETCSYPPEFILLSEEGRTIYSSSLSKQRDAEQEEFGEHSVNIGWFELQQALLQAVPDEVVVSSRAFSGYEMHDHESLIHFEDNVDPVRAKVVIGCDGYFSKLRAQWLNDGLPMYGNSVIIRGRVPTPAAPQLSEDSSVYAMAKIGQVLMVYPGSKGQLVWVAGVQQNDPRQLDMPSAELKQLCLDLFATMPPSLLERIAGTPESSIVRHEVRYRDPATYPDTHFGHGPISLAGDAAHPYRPTGLGTTFALEDAVVLARCISKLGPTPAALRAYEEERLPRWKEAAKNSTETGGSAYGGSINTSAADRQALNRWLNTVDLSL